MKKLICLLFLFTFSTHLFSGSIRSQLKRNQNEVENLKKMARESHFLDSIQIKRLEDKIVILDSQLRTQFSLQDSTSANISNQLDILNTFLAFAGILLTIIGVGIGIYVNNQQKLSAKNLKESQGILEKHQSIRDDIDGHLDDIYKRLNQKNIDFIIARIEDVPQDLSNLFHKLTVEDLNDNYFIKFKELAQSWENNSEENLGNEISSILALMVQHFPRLVLKDEEIFDKVLMYSDKIFTFLFSRELKVFLSEFCQLIENEGISYHRKKVDKTLIKLNQSSQNLRYSTPELGIKTIYKKLVTKSLKFEVAKIIKSLGLKNLIFFIYPMLIEEFGDADNLPINQKNFIDKIKITLDLEKPVLVYTSLDNASKKALEITKYIEENSNGSIGKWGDKKFNETKSVLEFYASDKKTKDLLLKYLSENSEELGIEFSTPS